MIRYPYVREKEEAVEEEAPFMNIQDKLPGSAGYAGGAPVWRSSAAGSNNKMMTPLKGSACAGLKRTAFLSAANPAEEFEVSVMLNRGSKLDLGKLGRKVLSDQEFSKSYGVRSGDVASIKQFAANNKLQIVSADAKSRIVTLKGTADAYEKAFGVKFGYYSDGNGGKFRGHEGNIHLPQELNGKVTGVFGLNNKPLYRSRFGFVPAGKKKALTASYTPLEVAKLYNFPQGTGKGQKIGIVEFGGGYKTSDLKNYFKKLGVKMPKIHSVSVDGATNSPTGDPNSADGEVDLDIENIGAIAPDADINVYFAPNDDKGSVDIMNQMIQDGCDIISISWGQNEEAWSPQTVEAMNQFFEEAAAKGITVLAASGDDGSSDGVKDRKNHVDFPASSPYVTGCGGTSLHASRGKISRETVWHNSKVMGGGASGGGYSVLYDAPAWQQDAHSEAGRGVCDVSGDADPNTGYIVMCDGKEGVSGGTSAVAPLWAGLIARVNQALGHPIGYINPLIYTQDFAGAFHDIKTGNNGAFKAKPGWDPPTGLGSPDGNALLQAFRKAEGLNAKVAAAVTPHKLARYHNRPKSEAA